MQTCNLCSDYSYIGIEFRDASWEVVSRCCIFPPDASMVGNPDTIRSAVAFDGGAGYIVPRDVVERLVFNPEPQSGKADDVYIAQEVQRMGGVLMPERRFYPFSDIVPDPSNRQITAHRCTPEDMTRIMEGLTK